MNKEEFFDRCIYDAIKMGRKYMGKTDGTGVTAESAIPTKEEWQLALLLFSHYAENDRT